MKTYVLPVLMDTEFSPLESKDLAVLNQVSYLTLSKVIHISVMPNRTLPWKEMVVLQQFEKLSRCGGGGGGGVVTCVTIAAVEDVCTCVCDHCSCEGCMYMCV